MFTKKYKLYKGREYFQGNYNDMFAMFNKLICKYIQHDITNNIPTNNIPTNNTSTNNTLTNININDILNKEYIFEDTIDKCNIANDTYNMVDFLKKYSDIPVEFIDDFYGVVKDYEELNYSFYISFDSILKWINQTKSNVKRTLIKRFTQNIDYTLVKVYGNAGKPKEDILLKLSTFKNICNLLSNKSSKEICKYFLHIEDILNKYKNYIINSLKK